MKIVLIDDDRLVCASLKTILQADDQIEVAAVGTSGEEGIALYRLHQPDILLMDIQMGGLSGLDAGERILSEFPQAKILFLTTFSDDQYIIRALRIGSKGYLIKQDVESIGPALKAVQSGQSVFGGEIMRKLPDLMGKEPKVSLLEGILNEREREVTKLVAKGLSNREIADTLYLSEGTVRNYISATLEKLSLRDRTQLAVYYYQNQ